MNINSKIEEKLEMWKKIKIIYWIVFWSGIIEEILKRRIRTTLAIGATIAILVTLLIAFPSMLGLESNRAFPCHKNMMKKNFPSEGHWNLR